MCGLNTLYRVCPRPSSRASTHLLTKQHLTLPLSRAQSTWNPTQYLRFNDERTTPVRDLIAKIPLAHPRSIIDLGCGPGNSTTELRLSYPSAQLTGMDSSEPMLRAARAKHPDLHFFPADLGSYTPETGRFDLVFSNAVFHWLPAGERVATMKRLLVSMDAGSVLALQVPDNAGEPSHVAMAGVKGPWSAVHEARGVKGNERFASPEEIYSALKPVCETVNVFHVVYNHVLADHAAVVEWVRGTGLRPFLDVLEPEMREKYAERYLEEVKKKYPVLGDGKVMLRYPRLFVVAVKG